MTKKRSKKEVKKTLPKTDFYLYIITHVKKTGKLPEPSSLNITKQNLQYYLNSLKIKGVLTKLGYATWTINEHKLKLLLEEKEVKKTLPRCSKEMPNFTQLLSTKKDKRGHAYIFTFKIPKLDNWHRREDFLKKKKIEYKKIPSGYSIKVRDRKVWLCNESIVIYTPKGYSYFGETAKHAQEHAVYDNLSIFRYLENMFKVSLRIHKEYRFKISKQHYGKINDLMAKQFNREGQKLSVKYNGKEWLLIDNSFNFNEIETVAQSTAQTDMDMIVAPFLNDLKAHYEETGESAKFSDILNALNKLTEIEKHNTDAIYSLTMNMNNLIKMLENRNLYK